MDKKEDNSIHIGNGNKIKNSVIGQNIKVEQEHTKEKWYQQLTWKLVVPIIVAVAAAALCVWLGIKYALTTGGAANGCRPTGKSYAEACHKAICPGTRLYLSGRFHRTKKLQY